MATRGDQAFSTARRIAGRSRSSARWRDSRASISLLGRLRQPAALLAFLLEAALRQAVLHGRDLAAQGQDAPFAPGRQANHDQQQHAGDQAGAIEPGAPREVRHPSCPGLHAATASMGCGAPSQREASGKGSASGAHRDDQR